MSDNLIAIPFAFLLALLYLPGCAGTGSQNQSPDKYRPEDLQNTFMPGVQKHPPSDIQAVQLHKKGIPNSLPMIRLNSEDKLILKFDFLGEESRQYKVQVSHRDKHWQESNLSPNIYLDSFYETYFGGGKESYTSRPSYQHFEYEFPNSRLKITASGNYLLEIYHYENGQLLFSLPFLVSENKGEIQTEIQELFAQRNDLRVSHQPVSDYRYPDLVEMPQFDLSFIYIQNQFWGRAREVEFFDTSTPGAVHFYLGRDHAFVGDYEFNLLDLRELEVDGQQILEVQTGQTPPRVILRRNIQHLSPSPRFIFGTRFGLPVDSRNAKYADVQFSLDASENIPSQSRIYIVGDFNNWSIDETNRMDFNIETGLWKGRALVKQGEYAYKYIRISQNRIEDLALDKSFTRASQEYTTLVYYRDPSRHYDRLLKTSQVRQ